MNRNELVNDNFINDNFPTIFFSSLSFLLQWKEKKKQEKNARWKISFQFDAD